MTIEQKYQDIKAKINSLIQLAEQQTDNYHLLAIFDAPGTTDAMSGVVYPLESENIETGFVCSAKYYTGYHNVSNFIGDLFSGKIKLTKEITYLVYSTAQIGAGINRRFLVPLVCEQLGLINLTCDAYTLGLLQNKAHHFDLLSKYFTIPQTYVFKGEEQPQIPISSPDIVLKPALECAALGVKKVVNQTDLFYEELQNMYKTFCQNILVQEYIDGFEVSVPVVNKGAEYIALPPVWVQFKNSILTYEIVDKVTYKMVALPDGEFPLNNLIPQLLHRSEKMMAYLGTKGITRADYRITLNGDIYMIDIAALPVLAHTGTCQTSFSALYPNNRYSIFQTLIGAGLFNLPNN